MSTFAVELTLDDFNPRHLVSANRRIHHYLRAEVCAGWRKLAHDAALAAYGHAEEGTWHPGRVRITVTYRFPDRRRRDVGNLYPYVAKPLVDGLVDAQVIPDDDDRHLIGPDLRRIPNRGSFVRIEIEDVP